MRDHDDERASGVERLVRRDLDAQSGIGRPLTSAARQSQRSVEGYLKAGVRPRWMERIGEIDARIAMEHRRLARAHASLRVACAGDPGAFARRWSALADDWSFAELNELIDRHNEWYPIERGLAIDPRTGEYVRVGGRSYRRTRLDRAWVHEHFAGD